MLRTLSFAAIPMFALALAPMGCASSDADDELAGEAEEAQESKADSGGTYTYFEIKRDFRRCIYPLCGGFWLDRLNATKTTCHDGSKAEECYAPVLDWSESGLTTEQQDTLFAAADRTALTESTYAIVRGRFTKKNQTTPMPNLGKFVVTEAWVAVGEGTAEGVFAKIKDNGLRCITSPCNSLTEYALNASRTADIAAVDFEAGDLSDAAVEGLFQDLADASFIVAGDRYNFKVQGRPGKGRTATNAFRNVKNIEAAAGECFVGGCSGQVCSDQEGIITTCEYRPEYACYQDATCERQATGECGWTQTTELQACLASPQQQY